MRILAQSTPLALCTAETENTRVQEGQQQTFVSQICPVIKHLGPQKTHVHEDNTGQDVKFVQTEGGGGVAGGWRFVYCQ